MMKKGFGLAVVLVLVMVIFTLLAAAVSRHLHTLRYLKVGPEVAKARLLADSGLEMAILLMRDQGHDWYRDPRFTHPITQDQIIDQSSHPDLDLGGTFELTFHNLTELYTAPGTFVTIRCDARSGRHTATSLATVKVTSLLTNYMLMSNGNHRFTGNSSNYSNGPILVNANGDEGDFQIWHDRVETTNLRFNERHTFTDARFDGSVRSSGRVMLKNKVDGGGHIIDPRVLNGSVRPGTVTHNDLPSPYTAQGSIEFTRELEVESESRLGAGIPKVEAAVEEAGTHPDCIKIDISAYQEGVLAEFIDGKLVLSQVDYQPIGEVFDADLFEQNQGKLVQTMADHHESVDLPRMEQLLRDEVAWDDPDFPNANYPGGARDLDGDGVNEAVSGDYFPLRHIVRGPPLREIALSRSQFSIVQLVTSRTDYSGLSGPQAPPVYVRGVVQGKINLSYNVDGVGDPSDYDRLKVSVLNQHEHPSETRDRAIAPAGLPGVPGGLRYQDPRFKDSPNSPTAGSDDLLILTSRGRLGVTGPNGFLKERIHRDGTPDSSFDYQQYLEDLDQIYVDGFGGPWVPDSFRTCVDRGDNKSQANLQGCFAANYVNLFGEKLTAEGALAPAPGESTDRRFVKISSWVRWDEFPTRPPGVDPARAAVFSVRFRNAWMPGTTKDYLTGAYSSLGNGIGIWDGNRNYDYSLRDLRVEQLEAAGVPIAVMLCSWQRR